MASFFMTFSGQGKYHIAVRQEIPKGYCVVKMSMIKPFQEAFLSHSLDRIKLVLIFNRFPILTLILLKMILSASLNHYLGHPLPLCLVFEWKH